MKILFMGTPDFALTILKSVATKHEISLVVTQPDRVNGRGGKITMSPVKEWALRMESKFSSLKKLNQKNQWHS